MPAHKQRVGLKTTVFVAVVFFCITSVSAQSCDGDDQPNHLIRTIRVGVRWLPEIPLPLKRGDVLTPDKLRESRFKVIEAIKQEKARFDSEFVKIGRLQLVDVNLVRSCVRVVSPPDCVAAGLTEKCVDVELKTYAISTDPMFMGAVLLPLPRSNRFTFLSTVPRLLRIFDPKFGLNSDRELGLTPEFEISTDLLATKKVASNEPAKSQPASLIFKARGGKSLSAGFYSNEAKLSLVLNQPNPTVESIALEASFAVHDEPQLSATYLRNSLRFTGKLALNPAKGIVNRVVLTGGYRRSNDRLANNIPPFSVNTTENSFEGRALLDGRILNGFTRIGLWVDGAKPKGQSEYRRVAGMFGYEKEIPVGSDTVGVETLVGIGKASNKTPVYGLFFGGNSLNEFIYQDIADPGSLHTFPVGPVLRSFGRNQAGFRLPSGKLQGANSFQHFNLTLALPIPSLSAPLIPDEVVNDNPRTTLRDLIEFAVNSGEESLSLSLQDEGLSEDQANEKAAQVFGEIRPGVKYLTNYAKTYSVKPLFMFDQVRLGKPGNDPQSKYSVGAGVQLTIVVARFQAGYMHAINRLEGERRGNFLFRLVFTNLF